YLNTARPFFENEWRTKSHISSIYKLNGVAIASYDSLSTTVGALSIFEKGNSNYADSVFNQKIQTSFHEDGYWGDPTNYYNQNWAWFGEAMHKGLLKKY